jgi:hypothetical protein
VDDLGAPPVRLALRGEEPRALTVNVLRGEVYVAFFESGKHWLAANHTNNSAHALSPC